MIWARDFVPNSVMEIPECFVYCGIFMTQSWDKTSGQIAKGEFFENPRRKMGAKIPQRSSPSTGALSAAPIFERLLKTAHQSRRLNLHLYRTHSQLVDGDLVIHHCFDLLSDLLMQILFLNIASQVSFVNENLHTEKSLSRALSRLLVIVQTSGWSRRSAIISGLSTQKYCNYKPSALK